MTHGRRTVLLGLIGLLSAGCAAVGSKEQAEFDRQLPRTREALYAAGDADSLAVAAMLVGEPPDAQDSHLTQLSRAAAQASDRLALLDRATALAPGRADLIWLQIVTCSRMDDCDPAPLARRLHAVDPGNAAAWAALLDRATKRGDADAVREYLSFMGAAPRFDIYWNGSIARLAKALIKTHTYDARTALLSVIGIAAALSIPAYRDILQACKAPALEDPDRLETCRRIASAMRNGDTCITEMIGIAVAKHVWPEGSAEYAQAVEARRVGRYRLDTEANLPPAILRDDAQALEYLRLLGIYRSEQEVMLAVLKTAGKDPTPPKEWKDPTLGG